MNKEINLKLKTYIQPFEQYLANAELLGLMGNHKNGMFSEPANKLEKISTSKPLSLFKDRLAYWEQIGLNDYVPTKQIALESEQGIKAIQNADAFRFHRARRLRYGPHRIHEYRGKFFPQLVKSLINLSGLKENSIIIDPMCGSGTTNCEARSMGMRTLGADMNPLSVMVSKVKTSIFDIKIETFKLASNNIKKALLEQNKAIHHSINWQGTELDYLMRWFDPNALRELSYLISAIERSSDDSNIVLLFRVFLSNIIREISWQKGTDLRVRKEVYDYPQGKTVSLFLNELDINTEKLIAYLSCFDSDGPFPKPVIVLGDARKADKLFGDYIKKCDCLITSPPYATALPYLDTDRLSLIILGLLPRSDHRELEFLMIGNREISDKQRVELWDEYLTRQSELPQSICDVISTVEDANLNSSVGFRKKNLPALLGKYFLDMAEVMINTRKLMKAGANAFFVVGNNSTIIDDERYEIKTDQLLWEMGKITGWKQQKLINMELLPSRDIFRSNRGTSESILWFKA